MNHEDIRRRQCYGWLCVITCICIIILISFLMVTFSLYLTITPTPTFTLHDVKLSTFNLSTTPTPTPTPTLTANLGITISARNTKDYLHDDNAFHFEKIDVYASYRNQQITPQTMLPPTYLHSPDVTVWSLSLNGTKVPMTPDLAAYLAQDVTVGNVLISVEVRGRLRSKSGFISRRYRLKVYCREYIMFGNDRDTIGFAFKRPFVEGCHVRVKPLKTVMQILTSAFHKHK